MQKSEMPAQGHLPISCDGTSEDVHRGDFAGFATLLARFQNRVERAATGRKHRPLREAWGTAVEEIGRDPDELDFFSISEKVVGALRLGCESGKVGVVDASLDCINRLFEYGYIGSPGSSATLALDDRDGTLEDLVAIVCSCLEVKDEDVYMRMNQTLLTASTRTKSGLHHATLLAAVRTVYNIFLNASMPGTRTTARVSLIQILNLVFSRMEMETAEAVAAVPVSFGLAKDPSDESVLAVAGNIPDPACPVEDGGDYSSEFATVLQKDAYLLFRALCKLSAKDIDDGSSGDNVPLRSKLLSLELLRNVISTCGPMFRSGDRFIYALRQYLSPSLLTNCYSNLSCVTVISFDILEMLIRKETLRPLLKIEIGVLFDTVIFRFLESHIAGPMRKQRALTLLTRLSCDRQTMADLFLNYDCDLDSPKIFERMTSALSATAEIRTLAASVSNTTPQTLGTGHIDVRVMALSAVVQVVRSLREWSKPYEHFKQQHKEVDSCELGDFNGRCPVKQEPPKWDVRTVVSPMLAEKLVSQNGGSVAHTSDLFLSPTPAFGINELSLGTIYKGSDKEISRFEEVLRLKHAMAEGIALFNTKPKVGVQRLVDSGRLMNDANAIANFLHKAEDLDASMVGEYLGEGGTFNISVMHAYTDMSDFTGMAFDIALRKHLSGFRLPGEAQKIDRIMEKFASRYCECNSEVFVNSDAAYVLAYSTIMLHTDAHNDTIKHKMSKEDFIRNNRGINDGGDLDSLFLGALYDRITKTEIRLVRSTVVSKVEKALDSLAAPTPRDSAQCARLFNAERERLLAKVKGFFDTQRKWTQGYTYFSATNVNHARLMFNAVWCPVLAAISLNLEDAAISQTHIVSLCLDGFRHGIAVSSTFGLPIAKSAFVSSLAKFTHLTSIAEMRPKNVECIRMVLAIAALEGNNLGSQWDVIVRAISMLEQTRAFAAGNTEKFLLQNAPFGVVRSLMGSGINFLDSHGVSDTPSSSSAASGSNDDVYSTQYRYNSPGKAQWSSSDNSSKEYSNVVQKVDAKTASMINSIAEGEIERIFANSCHLSAAGVADLCSALCTVALEELGEDMPRLFCLQKLTEVAYYNIESRNEIQWERIWLKIGPFFTSAMCHGNLNVALYSIDALRQLASKFLNRDKLSKFSFQRAFLKPFEVCFSHSETVQIRELVLTCVSQIVLTRANNIRSGWKPVFSVLSLAADDVVEPIVNLGWEVVDCIVRKYISVLEDVFAEAVAGIAAYARSTMSVNVSLAAIDTLSGQCASSLANFRGLATVRKEIEASSTDRENADLVFIFSDVDAHIGAWFPVLTGLATAVQDERPAIRMAANHGLYKVLTDNGGRFSPPLWALVFKGVLVPLFDDVKHLSENITGTEKATIEEWVTITGSTSLKSLVDVFVTHIPVTRILLTDLLDLVRSWVLKETEVVAREGMLAMSRLVMAAGNVFNPEDWKLVIKTITSLFADTVPQEIFSREQLTLGNDPKRIDENISDLSDAAKNDLREHMNTSESNEDHHLTVCSRPESHSDSKSVPGTGNDAYISEASSLVQIDFRAVRAKCVVQLLLIQLVQEVVVSFYKALSNANILELSESLACSYTFARDFNSDIELRYSLWRSGFMNQVPNLLKQETNGLMGYLRLLFWLYLDPDRIETGRATETKVIELCMEVLSGYSKCCEEAQGKSEERRELVALSPVVCFIANSILQMSAPQFELHLPRLYEILLSLLEDAEDHQVRYAIARLFRERIKPVVIDAGSTSTEGTTASFLSKVALGVPQLPGCLRDIIIRIKLSSRGGQRYEDVCNTLKTVCGVRSVDMLTDDGDSFRVVSFAPDEMIIAEVTSLPFVKSATAEAQSNAPDSAGTSSNPFLTN